MPELEERVAAPERETADIKAKLAAVEGQFEFISGQLRTVQSYMHSRFDQLDVRLDEARAQVAALPRAVVELLHETENRLKATIEDARKR